mgnify:CR=1 FL=1
MHICMTKIISISDEAYEKLKRMKNEMSFSEIIIELTFEKTKDNLMKFAGMLSNEEADKIKKDIYSERKKLSSRRFK